MATPSFLTLPPRSSAPRTVGLTHVLDPGVGPAAAADLLAAAGAFVDIWKTGWGTAYVDPRIAEKIAVLDEHGVGSCLGGTLLEIAWAQGVAEQFAHQVVVVHQQDVQGVVNALWRGGAEAMQIMDQRVISTSAVRCVGNTLLLQGRVSSPPYTITAVGDVDAIERGDADAARAAVYAYVDSTEVWG